MRNGLALPLHWSATTGHAILLVFNPEMRSAGESLVAAFNGFHE
jgi:hypothetical protein